MHTLCFWCGRSLNGGTCTVCGRGIGDVSKSAQFVKFYWRGEGTTQDYVVIGSALCLTIASTVPDMGM